MKSNLFLYSPVFHVYAYSYLNTTKGIPKRTKGSNFDFYIYLVVSLEWSRLVMFIKVCLIQYYILCQIERIFHLTPSSLPIFMLFEFYIINTTQINITTSIWLIIQSWYYYISDICCYLSSPTYIVLGVSFGSNQSMKVKLGYLVL